MNDLVIQTNSFTPAKVEFNYIQIEAQLDELLAKYKGLVFTEETATDCKKTIADLRKGKKSVEDFRKETKAKLSESIIEFENDCKLLSVKFDSVILPLTEQADFFETTRKEEKRVKVQKLVDSLKEEFQLGEKHGSKLVVVENYLGISISTKKIVEDLTLGATILKENQDREESNISLITNIVEKANKDNGLELLPDTYTRMMEFTNTNQVVEKIYKDVEQINEKREAEKQRIIDAIKKDEQKKLEAAIAMQQEMEKCSQREVAVKEYPEEIIVTPFDTREEYLASKELLPFEPSEDYLTEGELITQTYIVAGTKEDLKTLERFLNGNFNEWYCGVDIVDEVLGF